MCGFGEDEFARDAFETRDPAGDLVAAPVRQSTQKRERLGRADDISGAREHRFEAAPEWSEIGFVGHECGASLCADSARRIDFVARQQTQRS